VGPQWGEAEVLGIAHTYEEATPEIRAARPKFICLNDDQGPWPDAGVVRLVREFLDEYYPAKSDYEH
jgi:hypothetical protein